MSRFLPLCLLLAGGAARAENLQVLTIEDAVNEALRVSDTLRAARHRVESAEDTARSARGRLLPELEASEVWQHYNSPFVLGPPTLGAFVLARNINTNVVTVSGQQPVLGLLYRSRDLSAASSSAEATRADEASMRSLLVEQVRTTYLRLFEAKASVSIAQASLEQLQKQLQDAQARFQAGTLTSADLLRFRTAVANARLQEVQASTQELTMRHELLTLLARHPEDDTLDFIEPVDLERQAASPVSGAVDELINRALQNRPEVQRAARQAEASRATSQARALELLPDVDIQAAYANSRGQIFQPENSFFVGVLTRWPFWTWGTREYAAQSARRQASAALALEQDTRRQVALEVSNKHALLKAQFVSVQVAETAMASAEEAYRVTSEQVAAGTATTTDLLDAQAALTTARLNLTRARYERAAARVSLDRATTAR